MQSLVKLGNFNEEVWELIFDSFSKRKKYNNILVNSDVYETLISL